MNRLKAHPAWILSVISLISTSLHAENLLDVYDLALQNDSQFQSARYSYEATLESRAQAGAAFLPQLSASASTAMIDVNNDRNDTYNSNTVTLSISQSLYNRSSQIAASKADLGIAQAQARLSASEQDLMYRTSEAYFNTLSAGENLVFAQSEKKAIEQQLEQAERRFEVGLIAVTDVKEAQAAYDLAVANEIAAEDNLANAREALRVMTGAALENLDNLKEDAPLIAPEPADVEHWVATAETSNLSLRVAEYDAELANKDIDAARSGHHPTIGLGGSMSKVNQDGGGGDSESGQVQLSLNLPIYSGGLTSSQTRQAKSQAQLAAEQYELVRRNTVQQTRNNFRGVLASISRVTALKQALQSTEIAKDAVETGFEVGTRTAVDVLKALRDTFSAKANYAAARYEYILKSLALKNAAGTLQKGDLESVNRWLQAN